MKQSDLNKPDESREKKPSERPRRRKNEETQLRELKEKKTEEARRKKLEANSVKPKTTRQSSSRKKKSDDAHGTLLGEGDQATTLRKRAAHAAQQAQKAKQEARIKEATKVVAAAQPSLPSSASTAIAAIDKLHKKQAEAVAAAASEDNNPATMFGQKHATRVITITSGKGGVGKTNVAVNLAIALQLMNKRTLLIDADIGMANVDVILGNISHRNLLDLLETRIKLSDVVMQSSFGISYISGSSSVEKAVGFTREEQRILYKKLADCDKLADIILIDTGAGLGQNVLDFIKAADETLLVTTNEPTSISDAYAVIKAYSKNSNKKNIRLLVNRVEDIKESEEATTKLQETAKRFLNMPIECAGYVFEDSNVQESVKKQMPFIVNKPMSPASKCIIALANNLLTGREIKVKRGWRGFLRRLFS